MERLLLRPSFEGGINQEAGYVLVDDVTNMGGTLAELANYLKTLEEQFHDQIRQQFGIHISALTANEANYLVGFRTFDEVRNRCVKAEKETHLRLLSKGIK